MKTVLSYEDARLKVRSHLTDYLDSKGIKSKNKKQFYSCIYPDHNDSDPSLHIFESYDGSKMGYCMGCNRVTDIFTAHAMLDGAPMLGYEFVAQNMKPLCDMFGIDFEMRPLTQEEIEEMNIKSVYKMVSDMAIYNLKYRSNLMTPEVKAYVEERQLTMNGDVFDFSLGYIPDWDELVVEMGKIGISSDYLAQVDIKKAIFNPNNLIFTVKDEYGTVRGFTARNCLYDEVNKVGSKYINTTNNAVHNKGHLLYNLNRALHRKVGKFSSLYITEGHTDAIALDRVGLKAVAIGSTKFTNEHITLLQRVGETDIVLILDGDNAGVKNTARAITEVMEGVRNFRVRIVTLADNEDPDSFVRKYGLDNLLSLPHVSAFEWRLFYLQEKTDLDPYELAMQVVPLIVNESSELQRDRMCKQLSDVCNIPIDVLRNEVKKHSDDKSIKLQSETESIVDGVCKSLKRNPTDAQIILADGLRTIRDITDKYDSNLFGTMHCLQELQNLKLKQELADDEDCINLFRMPIFEEKMRGSTAGKMFLLGGEPGAGKTSWLISYMIATLRAAEGTHHWGQRADSNRENNVSIIYHTVDDSFAEVIPRFIANLASELHNEVSINKMDAPDRYRIRDKEGLLKARNAAFVIVERWMREGRLIVKDATVGATLSTGENIIRNVKQQYPDRHIIYVIDNLYNLRDFAGEDVKVRIQNIAQTLKQDILVPNKIMGLATVEYRKGNESGKTSRMSLNEMIKETKSLEYLANWIGHLVNETYSDSDNTSYYFWDKNIPVDQQDKNNRSPIIKLYVGKNKITDFVGMIYYYLFQHKALFLEMTKDDVLLLPESKAKQDIITSYFGVGEINRQSEDMLTSALDLVTRNTFDDDEKEEFDFRRAV